MVIGGEEFHARGGGGWHVCGGVTALVTGQGVIWFMK